MTQPTQSSEDPAEGADDVRGRRQGSPTPAKDAPPPGKGSAHESASQETPDASRNG